MKTVQLKHEFGRMKRTGGETTLLVQACSQFPLRPERYEMESEGNIVRPLTCRSEELAGTFIAN
jgi:hypothetical protein